jgi:phage gpG-like protein
MSALTGIQERCRTALRELRVAGERSHTAAKMSAWTPTVVRAVLGNAVQKVAPTVRSMVMQKFRSSGIKSRTGALASALAGIKLELKWRGSKPTVVVSFPAGLSDRIYKQAASLNYGAVRQPKMQRIIADLPSNNEKARVGEAGVIGEKAKRTLKRQVTGQMGQSNRADTWRAGRTNRARLHEVIYDSRRALKKGKSYRVAVMARTYGNTVVVGNVIEQRNTSTGSFSIIPPRNFFSFTASEKQTIAAMIEEEVTAALQRS